MMDVATEYGIYMSLDTELVTLLYFISAARKKRVDREANQTQ